MPIIPPNIYYFNNSSQEKPPYIKILADYDSKKIYCKLTEENSKLKLFQKKWILNSFDKKREIEADVDAIDFSLAQKFPNLICETILFDGLLYKKVQTSQNFSGFENWPNISPGMRTYTVSSIGEFSISDYFKTKEAKQYYFCESGSGDISEEQFCSLIDMDTGGIDNKNIESQKILHLIGREKYKIFNLTIGTKQENKIISQTGIQFLLNNINNEQENLKTPPNIEFNNSIMGNFFVCKSNLFLFYPNSKKIIWTKNGKKISDVTDKILPEKYIEYGQNYQCANNNGESEKFVIDKKYLEINGPSQIRFERNNLNKIVQYDSNLKLPDGKFNWSCQGSSNVNCELVESGEMPGFQVKIIPNEQFRKSLLHEKIKIILKIDSEIFEKEIVIFNYIENESITEDVSNELSITAGIDENFFSCNIPDSIQKSSMINIYWFIDNEEVVLNRNKIRLNNVVNRNYVTCIIAGKLLNKNIVGATSYLLEDPNKKNPSWLKESYLVNLIDHKKKYLFTENSDIHSNNVNCYLTSEDNYRLTTNICLKDHKNAVYLNLRDNEIEYIKNYLINSQVIDLFNLPYFSLNIKIFEDEKLRNLKSKVKFFIPNEKPIIYSSGIFNDKNGEQTCFVLAKDPQNLFLSSQFSLEKSKNIKNISSFNLRDNIIESSDIDNIVKLLNKKGIFYYEYRFKFNQREDYCNVVVGNGTTISQTKTPKISEESLKKLLISVNNKSKNNGFFFKKPQNMSENIWKNNLLANNDKILISMRKSSNMNLQKPFLLKFYVKKNETRLDISYSDILTIQNFSQIPSELDRTMANYGLNIEEDDFGNFIGYFLSARVIKKDDKSNKNYVCETTLNEFVSESNPYKYIIYLNDNYLYSRQSSKENISFEIKNIKPLDTITCQVLLDYKIESSSYTEIDNTSTLNYCYALDKNNSILTFECPENIDINESSGEMTKMIRNTLISQFKTLDNITYAHMDLWSQSQKNKMSITTKIDEE